MIVERGALDRCPECDRLVNRVVNGASCPFCRDRVFERRERRE